MVRITERPGMTTADSCLPWTLSTLNQTNKNSCLAFGPGTGFCSTTPLTLAIFFKQLVIQLASDGPAEFSKQIIPPLTACTSIIAMNTRGFGLNM